MQQRNSDEVRRILGGGPGPARNALSHEGLRGGPPDRPMRQQGGFEGDYPPGAPRQVWASSADPNPRPLAMKLPPLDPGGGGMYAPGIGSPGVGAMAGAIGQQGRQQAVMEERLLMLESRVVSAERQAAEAARASDLQV